MKEKVVKLEDREYILRQFSIDDKINIRDYSLDTMGNVKLGTFQIKTLAASLKSWSYQTADGTLIPVSEANIRKHLDPSHFDILVAEAVALNELTPTEKKISYEPDVKR